MRFNFGYNCLGKYIMHYLVNYEYTMQNNFHNFSINYDFSSQNYKFNFEFMSLKSYLKKSQNYDSNVTITFFFWQKWASILY